MNSVQDVVRDFQPIREGTPTFLFSAGTFNFSVYTFTLMLGILAAILTILFFWRRKKYPTDIFLTLILITLPASIFGARLWYIFERLIYNPLDPFPGSHWYAVWEGGLAIQGGVIVPTVLNLGYIYTKRHIIDYRVAFGYILPAVLIGQGIGRWGNYANHEVYGAIDTTGQYSLIWGETIARNLFIYNATDPANSAALRIPLFLYESILNLVGYFVIVWIINFFGLLKPGAAGGVYLIWYGITRAVMEPLREESYAYYVALSYVFLVVGTIAFLYFQIFTIKRYKMIRRKYYFDYILVYRSSLVWLGFLKPRAPKVKEKTNKNSSRRIKPPSLSQSQNTAKSTTE